MLEDLATVFNDYSPVDVEFSSGASAAKPDGKTIAINPDHDWLDPTEIDGVSHLAITVDTTSHEVEHLRESDLESKKKFMGDHPEAPDLAGAVINILEDQYIDRTRTERWRGLSITKAFTTRTIMADDGRRPPMGDIPSVSGQLVEGLTQLAFAGYVKGFDDAPADVQKFLGWVRPKIEEARHESDPDGRAAIAEEVYDELIDAVPSVEIAERYARARLIELLRDLAIDIEEREGGKPKPVDLDDIDFDPSDVDEAEADDPGKSGESGEDGGGETDGEPASGKAYTTFGWEPSDGSDPDEVADEVDDIRRASVDVRDIRKEDESVEEIDGSTGIDFKARYDRLKKAEAEPEGWDARTAERDDAIDFNQHTPDALGEMGYNVHNHEAIERKLKESGLGREIEEAFRRFKTADDHIEAEEGDRINVDAVVDWVAGDRGVEELYYTRDPAEVGDRAIAVSLDASGSMNSYMDDAKVAVAAFAQAVEIIGDKFVANAWQYPGSIETTVITGPDEEFEMEHLDAVSAGGDDPIGYGMREAVQMLDECTARERTLIVVTDGKPHITGGLYDWTDEGVSNPKSAVEEAAAYTRDLRRDGYRVIGVGVGNSINEKLMREMFGDDGWLIVDFDGLADTLIDIYRKQMRT